MDSRSSEAQEGPRRRRGQGQGANGHKHYTTTPICPPSQALSGPPAHDICEVRP